MYYAHMSCQLHSGSIASTTAVSNTLDTWPATSAHKHTTGVGGSLEEATGKQHTLVVKLGQDWSCSLTSILTTVPATKHSNTRGTVDSNTTLVCTAANATRGACFR